MRLSLYMKILLYLCYRRIKTIYFLMIYGTMKVCKYIRISVTYLPVQCYAHRFHVSKNALNQVKRAQQMQLQSQALETLWGKYDVLCCIDPFEPQLQSALLNDRVWQLNEFMMSVNTKHCYFQTVLTHFDKCVTCTTCMFENLLINHDQLTTPNFNKLFVVSIIGNFNCHLALPCNHIYFDL